MTETKSYNRKAEIWIEVNYIQRLSFMVVKIQI